MVSNEMGKLTESMQGLREAVQRQERQLENFIKSKGQKDFTLYPSKVSFEELDKNNQQSEEHLQYKYEGNIHSNVSDTSQGSHWSSNIATISSSVADLKHILKNQERQVVSLITENEELKTELQKREKDLKKQKFLLKAERETFEKYKRETLNEVKRNKSEESEDEESTDKYSLEVLKLKSELAHYRQTYIEMNHTLRHLSKQVGSLKDEKKQLKDKLIQQEKRSNKFIYEMAQRFEISRQEMNVMLSDKLESTSISSTNLAVCKMADRNARLAYDNSMLKLELNSLKKRLIERKTEQNKQQCFTPKSLTYTKRSHSEMIAENSDSCIELYDNLNLIRTSVSRKSGLELGSKNNLCTVKESVISLVDRNKGNTAGLQRSTVGRNHSKLNIERHWACLSAKSSIARTESAPELLCLL